MPARKILLIEDDADVRNVLCELLIKLNFLVDVAVSGPEALRQLKKRHYDVIISDIHLPGIDGSEVYEQVIVSYPHLAGCFIFTTGKTLDTKVTEHLQRHGNRCVLKSFRISELHQAIQAVLNQPTERLGTLP